MKEVSDLFGKLCRRYFDSGEFGELKLELDTGVVMDDFPVSFYVDTKELRELEKRFLEMAKGKILDIGCGPGRIGAYLREKGLDVLGVDISGNLAYIAKKRGIPACQIDVNKELPDGVFDTVIMYGNGFGLPGSIENVQSLLERLHGVTSKDSIIIAESNDPDRMASRIDLDYQKRNTELGKYVGQRVWRIRSGSEVGEYENWVQIEPEVLIRIAKATGWKISAGPEYETGSQWGAYFFTLSKR